MSIIKECNSGIEVYEGYSPREITLMLYSPFESDCPVQLNKLSSEEYAMIPIFRQVKRLMEVIEEKKELKLTAKVYITIEKYTIFQLKSIPVLIVCEDKKSYLNAG